MLMVWGSIPMQAQPMPGDEQIHLSRYAQDSAYQLATDELEAHTYHQVMAGLADQSRSVLTIPVVVHVMHPLGSTTPGNPGNPTDQQIELGISWLNEAFRNQGAYAGGPFYTTATQFGVESVDTEIEFCLAQVAPDGTTSTGITRTETDYSHVSFNQVVTGTATEDQLMKAEAFWDSHQYLNLWIVSSICEYDNINCDIPGYAYLPGAHGTALDGVVLEEQFFGTGAEENAVAAYYFARYLNLWRTSYRDLTRPMCDNANCAVRGDRVCDTPPDSTMGGPALCGALENSCDSDSAHADPILNPFYQADVSDIYENYMDRGGNASCKNTFTAGQRMRMRTALQNTRQSLLAQSRCQSLNVQVSVEAWESPALLSCEESPSPRIRIRNKGDVTITGIRLKINWNSQSDTLTWQGNLIPGDVISLDVSAQTLAPGLYHLESEWLRVNGQVPNSQTHTLHRYAFWVMDPNRLAELDAACVDMETGELPVAWKPIRLGEPITAQASSLAGCTQTEGKVLRIGKDVPTFTGAADNMHWLVIPGPMVDPAVASIDKLEFDWAHHFVDSLGQMRMMLLSVPVNNCAGKIDTIWDVRNADLSTSVNPITNLDPNWYPLDCQDWVKQEITLNGWIEEKRQLVFAFGMTDMYLMPAYMDNICWSAQASCTADLDIPRSAGSYTASYLCQDNGWTHFIKAATASPATTQDQLLFSVKQPVGIPLSLPVEALTLVITDSAAYDLTDTAPYVENNTGFHAAGRYIQLDSVLDFAGKQFEARFYFGNDLPQSLAQEMGIPILDPDLLIPYTTPFGLDGRPENGQVQIDSAAYREFLPLAVDANQGWVFAEETTFLSGTIKVSELAMLGIGSGNLGLGFGARYPRPFGAFTAVQQGYAHVLNWETERELLADGFEILHSVDGKQFESLQVLPANGQDSLLLSPEMYSFANATISADAPTHYYAVLLHHTNGYVISSDTLQIDFDIRKLVKAYPNPLQQYLTIAPEFPWSESLTLQLFDSQQHVFLHREWTQPGEELRVEIATIPPGIYFFQVQSGEVRIQGKLLKIP